MSGGLQWLAVLYDGRTQGAAVDMSARAAAWLGLPISVRPVGPRVPASVSAAERVGIVGEAGALGPVIVGLLQLDDSRLGAAVAERLREAREGRAAPVVVTPILAPGVATVVGFQLSDALPGGGSVLGEADEPGLYYATSRGAGSMIGLRAGEALDGEVVARCRMIDEG